MPEVRRPDGTKIHWEEVGSGPTVVLSLQFFGFGQIFKDLIDDLRADFRVVTYHLRGTGESTRSVPYDMGTDAADLAAVIEDAGGPAVVVAIGDGTNRAVRTACERPDLVTAIVSPAGNPVGREAARGTDALVASESVLEALTGMMATDYRGALRSLLSSANPQMSEDELRERVQVTADHCPGDVANARLRAWIDDDASEQARSVGERLWLLDHGANPWFTSEVMARTHKLLPEAHVDRVEDGPLSRPDITAAYVRRAAVPRSVSA